MKTRASSATPLARRQCSLSSAASNRCAVHALDSTCISLGEHCAHATVQPCQASFAFIFGVRILETSCQAFCGAPRARVIVGRRLTAFLHMQLCDQYGAKLLARYVQHRRLQALISETSALSHARRTSAHPQAALAVDPRQVRP